MVDKLEEIFRLQKKFGSKFTDFDSLDYTSKQFKTLDFINHTIEELIELRRECPIRKHWSSKKDQAPDKEKLLNEYVDALHFFVTIALCNHWTAEDVYNAYLKKNNINHERQNENY